MPQEPAGTVRERLLENGILELHHHGIADFSVRRVAKASGVSCAAPYKHFEDKTKFIGGIIEHVIHRWESCIPEVIEKFPDSRSQLTEIALRYVRFLVENSHFRSIIMLKDPDLDRQYSALRLRLTNSSRRLVYRYCEEVSLPPERMLFKLYVVRSLMYGAALMFDNGELAYTPENMQQVRRAIDREFDLP